MLILLSRIAGGLALLSAAIAIWMPHFSTAALSISAASALALWVTRELGHRENSRLRAILFQHDIKLVDLEDEANANHPGKQVAAAIFGQHELATMGYEDLVQRLKDDGYIRTD